MEMLCLPHELELKSHREGNPTFFFFFHLMHTWVLGYYVYLLLTWKIFFSHWGMAHMRMWEIIKKKIDPRKLRLKKIE